MCTHGEVRPPPLNGDQECEPSPAHGREVEFNFCPGQDEPPEALQALRDRQPEDYRQQDRKIGKGYFHGLSLLEWLWDFFVIVFGTDHPQTDRAQWRRRRMRSILPDALGLGWG